MRKYLITALIVLMGVGSGRGMGFGGPGGGGGSDEFRKKRGGICLQEHHTYP